MPGGVLRLTTQKLPVSLIVVTDAQQRAHVSKDAVTHDHQRVVRHSDPPGPAVEVVGVSLFRHGALTSQINGARQTRGVRGYSIPTHRFPPAINAILRRVSAITQVRRSPTLDALDICGQSIGQ